MELYTIENFFLFQKLYVLVMNFTVEINQNTKRDQHIRLAVIL